MWYNARFKVDLRSLTPFTPCPTPPPPRPANLLNPFTPPPPQLNTLTPRRYLDNKAKEAAKRSSGAGPLVVATASKVAAAEVQGYLDRLRLSKVGGGG